MSASPSQFTDIATSVVGKTAAVLDTAVHVIDARGYVVSSTAPDDMGSPYMPHNRPTLRLPLHVNETHGEVIVDLPCAGDAASPRLAQVLVQLIMVQALAATRTRDDQELKEQFIHDLLHGSEASEEELQSKGQQLGIDLSRPRAVLLINAAEYIGGVDDTVERRRARLAIASVVGFFKLPDDTICAYIGEGEIAVLKASATQDLAPWTDESDESEATTAASWANLVLLKRAGAALVTRLEHDTGTPICIGIGRYHPGAQGVARSYQDARAALSLGRRFGEKSGVYCLDGLGVAAFVGVADEATKVDLARHLLSPLDQEPDLLGSLDVFFASDCCPSETAQRLTIHRNTLGYRLGKIASLTGLDPRHFDSAVQMRLALILRSLAQAS